MNKRIFRQKPVVVEPYINLFILNILPLIKNVDQICNVYTTLYKESLST